MESLRPCFPLRSICNSFPNNGGRKSIEDNREELEKEISKSRSHSSFESFRTNSTTGQVSQKLASVSSSFNSRENASTLYNEVISKIEEFALRWPLMKYNSVLKKENKIPRYFERQVSIVKCNLRLSDKRGFISSLSSPISLETDTSNEKSPLLSLESSSKPLLLEREESLRNNLEDVCENTSSRKYTYQELYYATFGFALDRVVGKGGWSRVYKGKLQDGRVVAVKRNRSKIPLPSNERLKVAVRITDALDYLQDSCPQPIIQRDMKCSNIMLDNDFTPQLSDFDLVKWVGKSSYITCPDVIGTFGPLHYFVERCGLEIASLIVAIAAKKCNFTKVGSSSKIKISHVNVCTLLDSEGHPEEVANLQKGWLKKDSQQ